MVSIPQAVGTVATGKSAKFKGFNSLEAVSIPQAVGTVATRIGNLHENGNLKVSIPQAVGTVATYNNNAPRN